MLQLWIFLYFYTENILTNNKKLRKKTINKLIIVAVLVLTATTSFGQCTFTVTDSQPFVESFDDGLECWTVEAICGGGMESDWATPVTIALPSPSATYQIGFDGIGHGASLAI